MTLKVGTPEQIKTMFTTMTNSSRALIKSVIELVYFMRGSIQYDDMMWRTPFERDMFAEFIRGRLERESKKDFPVY